MTDIVDRRYYELVDLHDRQFQKYSVDNKIYCVPVDEDEEERLIRQHHLLHQLFNQRLFFPPLQYPRKILDCGYGRGEWAKAMAETYTYSEVTALDLYPAELDDMPDNLEIECWDLNEPLTSYPAANYDLIHSRLVGPGIHKNRWTSYLRDLTRLLKRGGYIQLVEFYYNFQSDSGRLGEDHCLYVWGQLYRRATERDRDPRVGRRLKEMLRNAGLSDVQEQSYRMPIGAWSSDHREREIGRANARYNIGPMLDSLALWQFTERLGWTKEQVQRLTDGAREELEDTRLKLYIPL